MAFINRLLGRASGKEGARPGTRAAKGMTTLDFTAGRVGEAPVGQRASAIEIEALDWLTLMLSGEATKDDIAAMERWRQQSSEHAEAMAAAVRLRRLIAAQPTPARIYRAPVLARPVTRRFAWGGLAAAAAAYSIVDPPLGLWPSWAELTSDFRTGTGERREVALADGVSLDLNTGTSIARVDRPGLPGIKLISGEVAAAVALPSAQTFVVTAGPGQVIAQSARLDIRVENDGYCTNCLGGSARVLAAGSRITLQAGEAVVYTDSGMGKPYRIDELVVTAWQRGQLIFRDAPLGTIVSEINRYRHGRIIIVNSELARRRFNGIFAIARIGDVVADLQRLSNASATSLVGGVVVLS
jgi:transmembrane sensor